jgi:hypothetical protein
MTLAQVTHAAVGAAQVTAYMQVLPYARRPAFSGPRYSDSKFSYRILEPRPGAVDRRRLRVRPASRYAAPARNDTEEGDGINAESFIAGHHLRRTALQQQDAVTGNAAIGADTNGVIARFAALIGMTGTALRRNPVAGLQLLYARFGDVHAHRSARGELFSAHPVRLGSDDRTSPCCRFRYKIWYVHCSKCRIKPG